MSREQLIAEHRRINSCRAALEGYANSSQASKGVLSNSNSSEKQRQRATEQLDHLKKIRQDNNQDHKIKKQLEKPYMQDPVPGSTATEPPPPPSHQWRQEGHEMTTMQEE